VITMHVMHSIFAMRTVVHNGFFATRWSAGAQMPDPRTNPGGRRRATMVRAIGRRTLLNVPARMIEFCGSDGVHNLTATLTATRIGRGSRRTRDEPACSGWLGHAAP
jgi:hypothetical protein